MFEFRHLAVFVSDLRRAEQYYQDLFRMELIGREAEGEDGETYALPPNRGWEEAEEAGIQLSLVALRRDEVILALFRGQAGHDQVYAVGLVMDKADMAEVRARFGRDASLAADEQAYLEFVDPFGLRWQISTDRRFRTAGEIAGRWLAV